MREGIAVGVGEADRARLEASSVTETAHKNTFAARGIVLLTAERVGHQPAAAIEIEFCREGSCAHPDFDPDRGGGGGQSVNPRSGSWGLR